MSRLSPFASRAAWVAPRAVSWIATWILSWVLSCAASTPSAAAEAVTFFGWSDQHVAADGDGRHLEPAIDAMRSLPAREYPEGIGLDGVEVGAPAFVFGAGDITEWPTRAALATYERLVTERLRFPSFDIAGNHDDGGKAPSRTVLDWLRARHGGLTYSFDRGGVRFLALWSRFDPDGRPDQAITEDALAELRSRLRAVPAGMPVVVATHLCHDAITNKDALVDAFGAANVILVLGGHYHRASVRRHRGIPFVQLPSPHPGSPSQVSVIRISRDRLVAIPWDYGRGRWVTEPGRCLVAARPESSRRGAARTTVRVRDTTGREMSRIVTGGVPLAKGSAPSGTSFLLDDDAGRPVPCQTSVLARWPDGSARWVLLDFLAKPPSGGSAEFHLRPSVGPGVAEEAGRRISTPVVAEGSARSLSTSLPSGSLTLAPSDDALLRIGERLDLALVLTDAEGRRCPGRATSVAIETAGPIRSTLLVEGEFRDADGRRCFGLRLRASLHAGLSGIRLEPGIIVDSERGVVQEIRALDLEIRPPGGVRSARLGGAPGWAGRPAPGIRLFQVDDRSYRLEGAPGVGSQAPGWAEIEDGGGTVAVAVRDFWQQWPKSLEVSDGGLVVGLLPRFEAGAFDHMQPWYKHQYLFRGSCYRLRTGQARRWQVWLDLSGRGEDLARCADAPLAPAADPAQAIATGVWGPIAAAGSEGMEGYDAWVENLFENGYCRSIQVQRDYGAMNWGDWWGERGCNWGNHEYDTPRHFLIQYARTGDPRYLHAGDVAARHMAEVDVVHFVSDDLRRHFEREIGGGANYPARPGMVHQHCVGHVSGFYPVERIRELYVSLGVGSGPRPYLCLDPYNLGHIWTQGMVQHHFLTGDPWTRRTVETIGRNLARLVEDRKFRFRGHSHCGRVNGWTMLALAGAYELDPDERYLRAMRRLADDALSEQDPETGGWIYTLPTGHCNCETKHRGEAAFIGAVRLNGLSRYYQLTGDPRIPQALRRGVTHLNRDTWMEEHAGWRYTSCPRSASGPGRQTGVIVMALVSSVSVTGDPEHLRILRKAWAEKFRRLRVAPAARPGVGKTFSTILYGCPEAMHLFVHGAPGAAREEPRGSP